MSASTGRLVGFAVFGLFLLVIVVWVVVFQISQTIPNRTLSPAEEQVVLGSKSP
jgi:hypothetical protein